MTTKIDPSRNSRAALGVLFAAAGIAHFTYREFFDQLVPDMLADYAEPLNIITGTLQIVGAITMFIPPLRNVARWTNLALLVPTLLPAVGQMLSSESLDKAGVPPQFALFRVFAQLFVIAAVWWATRTTVSI